MLYWCSKEGPGECGAFGIRARVDVDSTERDTSTSLKMVDVIGAILYFRRQAILKRQVGYEAVY